MYSEELLKQNITKQGCTFLNTEQKLKKVFVFDTFYLIHCDLCWLIHSHVWFPKEFSDASRIIPSVKDHFLGIQERNLPRIPENHKYRAKKKRKETMRKKYTCTIKSSFQLIKRRSVKICPKQTGQAMFYLYYLNIVVFRILDVIYQRREAKFYHISKQRKEN